MENYAYVYCPRCAAPMQERIAFVTHIDPQTAQNRILLIQRAVDPAKGKWALPGGYMDADEMPEAALKRELIEEVGLEIEIEELLQIFPMTGTDQVNRGIVLAYRARPADPMQTELYAKDDVSAACWRTREEIPDDLAFEITEMLLEEYF